MFCLITFLIHIKKSAFDYTTRRFRVSNLLFFIAVFSDIHQTVACSLLSAVAMYTSLFTSLHEPLSEESTLHAIMQFLMKRF